MTALVCHGFWGKKGGKLFWAVCISRECWEMPGNAGKFFKLAKIGVFSAVDYLSSIIMPFNNISMYVYKQKET